MNWTDQLGFTLLHFLWQGSAIGLIAAGVLRGLRGRSANARYVAACAALALMAGSVVGTYVWLNTSSGAGSAAASGVAIPAPVAAAAVAKLAAGVSEGWRQWLPWFDCLWFAGVAVLAARSFLSWRAARRLCTQGVQAVPREWQARAEALLERLAVTAPVRVCESALAEVPGVVGFLKPMVLLPGSALAGLPADQLETILAHELAHIRRHDYLVNLLQTAVETLLFYHPAVWWVSAVIRTERENCCDDVAVAVCGSPFKYASALARLEQMRHSSAAAMALAATDGSLVKRISRLLGQRPASATRTYWLPGALLVLIAAAGLVAQQRQAVVRQVAPAVAGVTGGVTGGVEAGIPQGITEGVPGGIAEGVRGGVTEGVKEGVESGEEPEPQQQAGTKEDFIDAMARAGLKNLSVDQLVALKIHGVTPEYIGQMKAAGFPSDPEHLAAFRIHGITPEYANEWKSRGMTLTPDQLMAFKIHNVTAASLDQMKALGYALEPEKAVAMRIHSITPEYAKSWREAGYPEVTFDQLLALKIHGADGAYVAELKKLGFSNLSVDQILQARIFSINSNFVASARRHGFENLTFQQLVRLKMTGVISDR